MNVAFRAFTAAAPLALAGAFARVSRRGAFVSEKRRSKALALREARASGADGARNGWDFDMNGGPDPEVGNAALQGWHAEANHRAPVAVSRQMRRQQARKRVR